MRLAVFGGSFNPPHVAHVLATVYVLETQGVDAVWIVPCFHHAFDKALAPFEDRLEMCREAFAFLGDRAVVSDVERAIAPADGRPSYTVETMEELAGRKPGAELRLVIGADILADRHKWHRWDDLARLAPPIVLGRQGYALSADLPDLVELPAVSSTEVRARLAMGESAAALVPARVLEYVIRRGLYRR
jgi:nicotinate-nucleotide adenylyltransferase